MIEVTINETKQESADKFPMLMISTDADGIMLMQNCYEGTIVGGTYWKIGFHRIDWNWHMLKPFHGSITLRNKE
jgi:hypothetical protein